jgi:hypothetical protein
MKLQVRWNKNAYDIYDVDVEEPEGRLIVQENMWDHGWDQVRDEYGGDADAYVLARHEDVIKEYVDTGMTYFQWMALGDGRTLIVPTRKISLEDMHKYSTINVHLGKGKEGIRRQMALKMLAAQAGYYWNNEPSIGRWLSAVADEQIGATWRRRPAAPGSDLAARVKAMAIEQIKMWQALLAELE